MQNCKHDADTYIYIYIITETFNWYIFGNILKKMRIKKITNLCSAINFAIQYLSLIHTNMKFHKIVTRLTLRLPMSYIYIYIYMEHLFLMFLGHTQQRSMRPLTCWDRGFESYRRHEYLSVVSVVCCHVEVSTTSWSLVQRSPTDCAASLCVI